MYTIPLTLLLTNFRLNLFFTVLEKDFILIPCKTSLNKVGKEKIAKNKRFIELK